MGDKDNSGSGADKSKGWFKRHPVLTVLIVLFIFGLIGKFTDTSTGSDTTPTQKINNLETGFIGGVEGGECVVPMVNLWDEPGGLSAGANVVDSVEGCVGMPVQIIETTNLPPRVWYHVQTYGATEQKSGWVSETLIITE